jgi:DNA-binding transcriptional regulator LsrR (DeoR family)
MTRNEEMAQMAFDGATQREIAEKYGVPKQRVAQIVGFLKNMNKEAQRNDE